MATQIVNLWSKRLGSTQMKNSLLLLACLTGAAAQGNPISTYIDPSTGMPSKMTLVEHTGQLKVR